MLPDQLRVLYLHGFASSPASRKARFFAAKLDAQGQPLEIPDLAEHHFERLTISGQLALIEQLLAGQPAALIGSSLGGYLAALYASHHPEVQRMVLLAPAFDFYHLWMHGLGPDRMASWKQNGTIPVFHYAEGRQVPLGLQFIQDAARFPPFPHFLQQALLFHGNQDDVVPVHHSVLFAAAHPNVHFRRLDSDHELTGVMDAIWLESQPFLFDSELPQGC